MFVDRVAATLSLTIGGVAFPIAARSVERFEARLDPWGFRAEVAFWVVCASDPAEDTLFAAFVAPDLASAALSLARAFDEVEEAAAPVVLQGLVLEKSVTETAVEGLADAPVLRRRYVVRFADRAAALWGAHFPTSLYVDSSYQALFADNLPTGLTLVHSWAASTVTRPVLSLGLGGGGNRASFRDFAFWLLDREGAGLFYDVASDAYTIRDSKPSGGAALALEPEEVAALDVIFPRVRRATPHVLNSYTEATDGDTAGSNAQAVQGLRMDFLLRSPIASDTTSRSTLEASRAGQALPRARLSLQRFPAAAVTPNAPLSLGGDFSASLFTSGLSFLVASVDVAGVAIAGEGGPDAALGTRYELRYDLELEQASDPVFRRPPFVRPLWPFHVEGKVVSAVGADDELTYQIYQDPTTSLDLFRVAVPLFDGKQIVVSYEPITQSGHFYFPAYKGERVLAALEFDRARFDGYLDWRAGARLPLEAQGNQLLLGKKATSQTYLQHYYQDGKPILAVQRTADTDQQTITVLDGTLRMITQDSGS